MIVRSRVGDCGRVEYRARVSIANTDVHVLKAIRGRFGGMLEDQPPAKVNWNHAYQLIWSEQMGKPLLEALLPHLRLKHRQARLLLEFIAFKHANHQGHLGRSFAPLAPDVVALRESYYQEVSGLNARGTIACSRTQGRSPGRGPSGR